MKLRKIIGIAALVVVIILVIAIGIQPLQAHIEESIVAEAPPSAIFAEVSNYRRFTAWSPWNKMGPEVTQTFEGVEGAIGLTMKWDGPKTGRGFQRIVELEECNRVKNIVKFREGMDADFNSEVLAHDEDGTLATWMYNGPNNGMAQKRCGYLWEAY